MFFVVWDFVVGLFLLYILINYIIFIMKNIGVNEKINIAC